MKRRNNDGIYKSKLRAMYDVQEATQILQGELISYLFILCTYIRFQFEGCAGILSLVLFGKVYDAKQIAYVKKVGDTMTAGEASSKFVAMYDGDIEELQQAVLSLAKYAANEREESSLSSGRLMLGICGLNVEDCLATLKSWVTTLQLPRGLLHGADVAGVPIDTSTFGRAFVKYNTGMFSRIIKEIVGF